MSNLKKLTFKVVPKIGYSYNGLNDIPGLIKFVGTPPLINADLTLSYKKQLIKAGDIVMLDENGKLFIESEKSLSVRFDITDVAESSSETTTPKPSPKK
jgi:hypothetical protein